MHRRLLWRWGRVLLGGSTPQRLLWCAVLNAWHRLAGEVLSLRIQIKSTLRFTRRRLYSSRTESLRRGLQRFITKALRALTVTAASAERISRLLYILTAQAGSTLSRLPLQLSLLAYAAVQNSPTLGKHQARIEANQARTGEAQSQEGVSGQHDDR